MPNAKLLLVEDDAALAELLSWNFKKEEYDVIHTPDGEEALLLVQEHRPDVILLDWMLESLSGIEVCRRLRRSSETANIPIIMLTARGEEEDKIRGLETGADDYITKPFSPRELIARVKAVLRRVRPALAGEKLNFGDLEMDTVGHKVKRAGNTIPLGPTEFRLLRHFLEHPNWVFSRERLLDSVWGQDSDIELRTVDVHIRRLRKALNANGRSDIIRTVRSAGYALDTERPHALTIAIGGPFLDPHLRTLRRPAKGGKYRHIAAHIHCIVFPVPGRDHASVEVENAVQFPPLKTHLRRDASLRKGRDIGIREAHQALSRPLVSLSSSSPFRSLAKAARRFCSCSISHCKISSFCVDGSKISLHGVP